MSTFLLVAGAGATAERTERSARILTERARDPATARIDVRDSPPGTSALVMHDTGAGRPSMVSAASRGPIEVLAFGRIGVDDYADAAAAIATTWIAGGATAVTALDGSFGAVVLERTTGRIHILSDEVGTRTLRWIADEDTLCVSPHDITLATTGRLDPAWDPTTARSLLAYRWSIGGASLHPSVAVANAAHRYTWEAHTGLRSVVARDLPDASADTDGSRAAASDIVDALETIVGHIADRSDRLRTTLTAGLDSRLTLAVALRTFAPDRIATETTGRPDDMDVREARRLSRLVGVDHELITPGAPTDIDDVVRDLAADVNGQTSAKRALNRPSVADVPTLTGQTAEIFRGRRWRAAPHLRNLEDHRQIDALVDHFRSIAWQPGDVSLVDDALGSRLHRQLDDYRALAVKPFDILDLFYVLDKTARWSSMLERDPAFAHVVSPFKMPSAVRHVTRLAPAWREPGHVHRLALERWSPRLLGQPINLVDLLPAVGESTVALRRRQVRQRLLRLRRDVRARRAPPRAGEYHAEALAPSLERMTDVISGTDGIASTILGDELLASLVTQQRSGVGDRIEELGQLWSMEVWRSEMAATIAAARA